MKIFIPLLITLFFLTIMGCSKTEQPSDSIPKLVWKSPLLDGHEAFSFSPVIYKDIVIYGAKYARLDRSEKVKVIALKKTTGEKVWEWMDSQSVTETLTALSGTYTYNNIFIFTTRSMVYAIDMNTGKSLWSTNVSEARISALRGVGDKFYYVRANIDNKKSVLCSVNMSNGDWHPVFTVEQPNKYASFDYKMLVRNENGENNLYFTYSYTNLEFTASVTYLSKMNVATDSIIFDKLLPMTDAYGMADIDDRGVYLVGAALRCFNKNDGEFIRKYDLYLPQTNGKYGPGRCIAHENKLFAPTSFPKLVCYDIVSGGILWTDEGVSTSLPSELIFHDGIIYYTSSSDGFLHAIDENGKRFWKFQSPDKTGSGDGIFADPITIDAKENRLYVSSYFNAICYETIKK